MRVSWARVARRDHRTGPQTGQQQSLEEVDERVEGDVAGRGPRVHAAQEQGLDRPEVPGTGDVALVQDRSDDRPSRVAAEAGHRQVVVEVAVQQVRTQVPDDVGLAAGREDLHHRHVQCDRGPPVLEPQQHPGAVGDP